jgi:N-acetylneuraminic acid mutarotase
MARLPFGVIVFEPLEARQLLAASTIRIDAGGDGHTEASGKVWAADRGFTAGTAAGGAGAVVATTEDALFDSRRFGSFSYSLPIKSGTYRVKLLFSEPVHSSAGDRKFDVFAEKKLVLNDFDIAAVAGQDRAVTKSIQNVTVKDGRLNLWFTTVVDNAIVSAIEVTPSVPAITFRPVAKAPLPRFEGQGEVVGDKLFVFGGFQTEDIKTTDRAHVFDSATGTWSEISRVPIPETHAASASDGQFIYLAGGAVGDWMGTNTPVTRKVFRYDTASNTWASMLQLPQARAAGALVRVGRKLHFFGGFDQNYHDRGEHWTLDLREPTVWRPDTPMPNPRNHLGSALVGTKVYAIGGQHQLDEENGNVAEVDAFDVVTGRWSQVASLPQPRSHVHNSTVVVGGTRLIVVGGATNDTQTLTDLLEYDAAGDKWTFLGQMPAPRQAAVAKVIGDHIIVTGGTPGGGSEIDPTTDTWISQ